jgi:hypothetical protein
MQRGSAQALNDVPLYGTVLGFQSVWSYGLGRMADHP